MPVPTSAFTVRDHPSWRCSGAALGFVIVLTLCVGAAAQAPPPAVRSPEVHGDRRVTFRLRAPAAARVELVGEVLQGQGPQAMTKGADGVWSVTIGPLPPEIWIYNFRIEGVDLPDPANISQMPRAAGTAISSFVEVPGDGAAFYDARPVPHGDVRMVLYESKAMGVNRYLWIYTPPELRHVDKRAIPSTTCFTATARRRAAGSRTDARTSSSTT